MTRVKGRGRRKAGKRRVDQGGPVIPRQRAVQEGDGSQCRVPWRNIVLQSDLWHCSFKIADSDRGSCLITLYLKRMNREWRRRGKRGQPPLRGHEGRCDLHVGTRSTKFVKVPFDKLARGRDKHVSSPPLCFSWRVFIYSPGVNYYARADHLKSLYPALTSFLNFRFISP